MKRENAFPSKYLKAVDLEDGPQTLCIEAVRMETLRNGKEEQTKPVIYFRRFQKGLIVNVTIWDAIVEIVGDDDSDSWIGHQVEAFASTVEMRGKVVGCVRVRAPAEPELKTGVKPAKRPAKARAIAKPERPPIDDDMNDEIPY